MSDDQLYWHFLPDDGMTRFTPRIRIEVGVTYRFDGEPKLCEAGYHSSRRALDALQYAPGCLVGQALLGGTVLHDTDKSVATERTHLWLADATVTLREFARLCALDVIHLWDAPAVVRQYLETGDESIRAAALEAARTAARTAAWDAAWAAQNERLTAMLLKLKPQEANL